MKTKSVSIKKWISLLAVALLGINLSAQAQDVNHLLLKDYRPVSIYKIPITHVNEAAFPVIDMHSHDYAKTDQEIAQWVKNMDACGIEKTIVLSRATGPLFDSILQKYAKYGNRFEVWCGFDVNGFDQPGFGPSAVKELERCYHLGARGVGELSDKGGGINHSDSKKAAGMHFDDVRLQPLYEKCAELHMPINLHLADPIWMYEKMDETNDGLMNSFTWQIDASQPGILGFDALIQSLEKAVKNNPKTIFIACHFANLNHDIERLGEMLDKYPNLYSDISARYAESATIPRTMQSFYERYQDRLLYGTDLGFDTAMYKITFRILESDDEHFYESALFHYHWAMNGFGLQKKILKKLYRNNALSLLKTDHK